MKKVIAALMASTSLAACVPAAIWEVTPIGTSSSNTPEYIFHTEVFGPLTYGGSCSSNTTYIEHRGDHAITLNPLADGTYSDCTISIKDDGILDYRAETLTISSFTIDTGNTQNCTPPTGLSYAAGSAPITLFPNSTNSFRGLSMGVTVAITSGFAAGDILTYNGSDTEVTTTWDEETGLLTINAQITSVKSTEIIRNVQFTTSSNLLLDKTFSYAVRNINSDQIGPIWLSNLTKLIEYVPSSGISYSDAKVQCESRSHFGESGHLVTVLDSDEQDALYQLFGGNTAWLGAKGISSVDGDSWAWNTTLITDVFFIGDNTSGSVQGGLYANWGVNEPQPVGIAAPNFVLMDANGYWTGRSALDTNANGFICEYNYNGRYTTAGAVNLQPECP